MTVSKKYISFRNRYQVGEGILSFIQSLLHWDKAVLALAFIALYVPEFKELALILVIPVIITINVVSYLWGWWLDKKRFFHEQTSWGNSRNPEIQKILKGQADLRTRLKRMENK